MNFDPQSLRLFLAPMEGLIDWVMRDILTEIGGIDVCATEFIRVTDRVNPESVFFRDCPELKTGSRTRAQVPIFVQLLGGKPDVIAENAMVAIGLGAQGIDLNFGCPAKTVNRHDGGAVLLKNPERVHAIVKAVRSAVPVNIPVTAKIRLGFDDPSICFENARAVQAAGANWLTVHARTKTDGYKPTAFWEWIAQIRETVTLPVVANGEIWNLEDFKRCRDITGSSWFMLGRGAIANPFLFLEIKQGQELSRDEKWTHLKKMIYKSHQLNCETVSPHYAQARGKQWLKQLGREWPEAQNFFDEIKIITDTCEFSEKIHSLTLNMSHI